MDIEAITLKLDSERQIYDITYVESKKKEMQMNLLPEQK